jgi:hypothetical protein
MRTILIVGVVSLLCLAICHSSAVAGFGDVWTSPDRLISLVPPQGTESVEVNSPLKSLKKPKSLSLEQTKVTREAAEELRKALPRCRIKRT